MRRYAQAAAGASTDWQESNTVHRGGPGLPQTEGSGNPADTLDLLSQSHLHSLLVGGVYAGVPVMVEAPSTDPSLSIWAYPAYFQDGGTSPPWSHLTLLPRLGATSPTLISPLGRTLSTTLFLSLSDFTPTFSSTVGMTYFVYIAFNGFDPASEEEEDGTL